MPSIIQTAFFIESLLNVTAIVPLVFYPASVLRPVLATNSISSALALNATTTFVARCAGALIFALTPQLLLALPDTKDCVGKRKLVYYTLGLGEAALIPLFLREAFREGAHGELGGLTQRAALLCAGALIPPMAWRVFVFTWKPHWFGRVGERERETTKTADQADADDLVGRWSLGRKEE